MGYNPMSSYPRPMSPPPPPMPKRSAAEILEDRVWTSIRKVAKENEGLQDLLDRAMVYYRLLEKEQNNK